MNTINFQMDFGTGFVPVKPPRNWKAMKVQLIFTKDHLQAQLQTINFEWVLDTARDIKKYVANGMNGGTGIFEGIGLRVFVGANQLQIFDGCLDLTSDGFLIDKDIVKCPIKESGKIDWLNDVAPSITFAYLASDDYVQTSNFTNNAYISRNDYKLVPYTRSAAPDDNSQILMLSITTFIMIKEAYSTIEKIIGQIESIANSATIWGIIIAILIIILDLMYLALLITQCIDLIEKIINIVLPPKKYKMAMREVDLWKKACAYFGLTFVSSIYGFGTPSRYDGRYDNATWMPVKIILPQNSSDPFQVTPLRANDELNSPNAYGYFDGTFKDWIDVMCMRYNAKVVIQNNTLRFEELHYWNVSNPFKLPNEGDVGYTFGYPQPYNTNASELVASYIVKYTKDDSDLNTYNDYRGTYCLATNVPTVTRNVKNRLLKGSNVVQLPCALARRKDYESNTERELIDAISAFNSLYSAISSMNNDVKAAYQNTSFLGQQLSSLFGNSAIGIAEQDFITNMATAGLSSFSSVPDMINLALPSNPGLGLGESRDGWMLLSSDFTGQPKSFIGEQVGDDWRITYGNDNANAAYALMRDFHSNNLCLNPYGNNNQWLLFKNKKFKFKVKDFIQINNNNVLVTADGQTGKFDELMWDLHNDIAENVNYRIKKDYTKNITPSISTDNG